MDNEIIESKTYIGSVSSSSKVNKINIIKDGETINLENLKYGNNIVFETFNYQDTTSATCTASGSYNYESKLKNSRKITIPALGHNWVQTSQTTRVTSSFYYEDRKSPNGYMDMGYVKCRYCGVAYAKWNKSGGQYGILVGEHISPEKALAAAQSAHPTCSTTTTVTKCSRCGITK